jgi:hypothetical protein
MEMTTNQNVVYSSVPTIWTPLGLITLQEHLMTDVHERFNLPPRE